MNSKTEHNNWLNKKNNLKYIILITHKWYFHTRYHWSRQPFKVKTRHERVNQQPTNQPLLRVHLSVIHIYWQRSHYQKRALISPHSTLAQGHIPFKCHTWGVTRLEGCSMFDKSSRSAATQIIADEGHVKYLPSWMGVQGSASQPIIRQHASPRYFMSTL